MTLTTINLAALGDTINLSTEVTGTLPTGNGGTGSTATTFVNAASNVTGTLPSANLPTVPVTKGGTGLTSGTTDQLLKFTGTTTLASSAISTGKIGFVNSRTRRGEYNISGNHGSGFVVMAEPYVVITPSSTSSRVKLTFQVLLSADGTGYKTTDLDIQRIISGGATTSRLAHSGDSSSIQGVAGRTFSGSSAVSQTPTALYTLVWIDNPLTTSETTYKLMSQANDSTNGNLYVYNNGQTCTFVGEEILP